MLESHLGQERMKQQTESSRSMDKEQEIAKRKLGDWLEKCNKVLEFPWEDECADKGDLHQNYDTDGGVITDPNHGRDCEVGVITDPTHGRDGDDDCVVVGGHLSKKDGAITLRYSLVLALI